MKFLWVQMALGLFQIDLAVKQEVENHPELETGKPFLNGKVYLERLHNYGIAGGRLAGHMPMLVKVSGLSTLGGIAMFIRLLFQEGRTAEKAGFAFVIGGALSNLYDRCRRGYVVDYVRFRTPFKKLSRLVFNLADFFILAGGLLICLGQVRRTAK